MENLTSDQKNLMTVHKDVRTICQEISHSVGMSIHNHAMELIAELVWKKMKVMGTDLESFAKHAKRSTINAEDVKLLVRRNPSLKALVTKMPEENSTNVATRENKKKKSSIINTPTINLQPSTSNLVNFTSNIEAEENDSPFIKMLKNKINDNAVERMEHNDTIDLT